jgi:hypothetical protein
MGKNKKKNLFSDLAFLSQEDIDIQGEQEGEQEGEEEEKQEGEQEGEQEEDDVEELENKIEEYNYFLRERFPILKKETNGNEKLSKNMIKIFFSIMDYSYDLINEITILLERNNIENRQKMIFDLDQKLNSFYKLMDKYRDDICCEEGFRRLYKTGTDKTGTDKTGTDNFLSEVDVYYNMFICSKCIRYIYCALEFSSMEMLEAVDRVFYKGNRTNERMRYETYLYILYLLRRKDGRDLCEKDIKILRKICQRDKNILNYFEELFDV